MSISSKFAALRTNVKCRKMRQLSSCCEGETFWIGDANYMAKTQCLECGEYKATSFGRVCSECKAKTTNVSKRVDATASATVVTSHESTSQQTATSVQSVQTGLLSGGDGIERLLNELIREQKKSRWAIRRVGFGLVVILMTAFYLKGINVHVSLPGGSSYYP